MSNISIKRLEKLEDYILKSSLDTIELDNKDNLGEIYEKIIEKVFKGELDDVFLTNSLTDEDNKKEIFELARKYRSLCFYQGMFDNWPDSPLGVGDLEIKCIKLLEDYDYLIRLAKNGKEDVLKFLLKFQESESSKKAPIISYLRADFNNDDVLEYILIEMSKEDGIYNKFTDSEKIILCDYPELLFKVNDSAEVEILSVSDLERKLAECYNGNDDVDYDIESIFKTLDKESAKELIQELFINKNHK